MLKRNENYPLPEDYESKTVTDNNINTYILSSSKEIKKGITIHYTTINCKKDNRKYQKFT